MARLRNAAVCLLCAALLADLDAFTDRRLEDDVALVALRFDGLGVS